MTLQGETLQRALKSCLVFLLAAVIIGQDWMVAFDPQTLETWRRNMMTPESPEFTAMIGQSAELRGEGKFDEAAHLIEEQIPNIDPDCLMNAYLEVFYAYEEAGNLERAKEYANKLHELEPGLPSIQKFVD